MSRKLIFRLILTLVLLISVFTVYRTYVTTAQSKHDRLENHSFAKLRKFQNKDNEVVHNSSFENSPADDYCNFHQFINPNCDEGKHSATGSWKLLQVQAVIRHGDRSPLNYAYYREHKVVPKYCKLVKETPPTHPLMNSFIDTISNDYTEFFLKKGKRYFAHPFPNIETCWNAYLSKYGVAQHLENGRILGDKYSEILEVFAKLPLSERVKTIHAETTNTPRTLQSIIAFLYGLLPDFHLNQVVINLTRSGVFSYNNCPKEEDYDKAVNLLSYKVYLNQQQKNPTNKKLANLLHMTEHPGPMIDRILNGYHCKGYKLPCNESHCILKSDLDFLMTQEEELTRQIEEPYRNSSLLSVQPLLKRILDGMINVKENKNNAKQLLIYSGHDTTLKPLISALNIKDHRWPRMASRLVFELWKQENLYKIRIIYNGVEHTLNSSPCLQKGEICSLDNFEEFVTSSILKHFNSSTLKKACEL